MKTKTKKIVEAVEKRDESLEQAKEKAVASQIEVILKENGYYLYPFIERLEYADVARVRLMKVPEENVKS